MRSVIISCVVVISFVSHFRFSASENDDHFAARSLYNIVAVFPFPGKSHWIVADSLLTELTRRGHNVTAYSNFPRKHPVSLGYKSVDISSCFPQKETHLNVWQLGLIPYISVFDFVKNTFELGSRKEDVISCKPLLDLIHTKEKYDLLMTEFFVSDWTVGYAQKLNIPFIAVSTCRPYHWFSHYIGLPEYPSYIRYGQQMVNNPSSGMSFIERVQNLYNYILFSSYYRFIVEPLNNEIMKALFGNHFPTFDRIIMNTSLLLLHSHFSINTVRPLLPTTVEFGSVTVAPLSPLPEEIEKFINGSEHGVIFFSMGSVLQSKSFPTEMKTAFLEAFSKLPNRIIWKFEETILPNKPDNVLISGWLPQRSILAHPKVELFISHCGQSSLNEAVEEAVPVLAIPIYVDQIDNADTLVIAGAAEKINFHDITSELLLQKINKILHNESYKINARRLLAIYKDRPLSPMDTAMYWIEYVIRHKGAHHLKSPAVGMPWYQYFLLDVIGFLLLIIISSAYVLYITLRSVRNKIRNLFKTVDKKAKIN